LERPWMYPYSYRAGNNARIIRAGDDRERMCVR